MRTLHVGMGFYLGGSTLRIRHVNYVRKVTASSDPMRQFSAPAQGIQLMCALSLYAKILKCY